MQKVLVNGLSIIRIPLGLLTLLLATQGLWAQALAVLLMGLWTDWMDGYFARKWRCGTAFGADVLEPICDLALTLGSGLGLLLAGTTSWWLLIPLASFGLLGHLAANYGKGAITRVGFGFMPLYYLAVIIAITIVYARAASVPSWGYLFAGCVGILAAWAKKDRLHSWTSTSAA